jgi:hypothetical protein
MLYHTYVVLDEGSDRIEDRTDGGARSRNSVVALGLTFMHTRIRLSSYLPTSTTTTCLRARIAFGCRCQYKHQLGGLNTDELQLCVALNARGTIHMFLAAFNVGRIRLAIHA